MDKFVSRINKMQVIMKPAPKESKTVEVICHLTGGKSVVVQSEHDDLYAAVDLVADKLQRQLTKFKSRREKGVRRGQAAESRKFKDSAIGGEEPQEIDDYDLLGDE
jgi:putative sigma-54 modulation protein